MKLSKLEVISFQSYKNFNGENFKQDLFVVPWHIGEVFEGVEDQLFFWNILKKRIVDEHAPTKIMGQDVPYMTTKWKNAIQAKWKAEARYRQNKTA